MLHIKNPVITALVLGSLTMASYPAISDDELDELLELSIADLQNREVTSVSKREEKISEAPAAVYVLTGDDIRRMGATSIAEALRVVPGLQVASLDSNKWAITSRGFSEQFSNKLLVMIDGRSVYTPLFSGVYWDVQDVVLEDIDRIEVIRGPGATLWGANAVNGVINIITRKAKYTQDTFVSGTYGTEEKGTLTVRQGGKIQDGMYYRLYAKHLQRDHATNVQDTDSQDEWNNSRVGFRLDIEKSMTDEFTIQSDFYSGKNEQPMTLPTLTAPFTQAQSGDEKVKGGNVIATWKHLREASSYELKGYVDYIYRKLPILDQERLTFDLEFQHNMLLNDWNDLTWGLGYRSQHTNLQDVVILDYTPNDRVDVKYNTFVQDKITIIPDELFLTLGSKFEHNDYTGFEYQPSARLSWFINDKVNLWSSVSRAVRTPSIAEDGLSLAAIGTPGGFVRQMGATSSQSEELLAYEVGIKTMPMQNLSVDISTFYNIYDLRTFDVATTNLPADTVQALKVSNSGSGEVYGIEISSAMNMNSHWTLYANYSLLQMDLHVDSGSTDFLLEPVEGKSPKNQFNLQSRYNINQNMEWDNTLYFVDNLSSLSIPSYTRFDTRFAWEMMDGFTLSLIGQNLFDDTHSEFEQSIFSTPTEIERSFYAKVTYRF